MQGISLEADDYFFIIRALVFAEIKRLRKNSEDLFGDELLLTKKSLFGQAPLVFSSEELAIISQRVAGFFSLPPERIDAPDESMDLGRWAETFREAIGPRPEKITFFTSGSTGEPKPVVREYFFLEQDALHLSEMLKGSRRILGLVPPHHIYGFIYTVLIPKILEASLEDLRFERPATIVKRLISGDCVVGFPHIWRQCSETRERFPAGVIGVTSTAPCPPNLIVTLKRQGLGTMVEIYGSSESGAMGYRFSPDAPLTLMATWKRFGENLFVRQTEDGSQSEPFGFQDELDWIDAQRFRVKKRLDKAVQVSGINVYPSRVREAILSHDAVADCAVRLMRPEEGERLKAFVVLKKGAQAGPEMRDDLMLQLTKRLFRVEQPGAINFGPELPKNEMGKLTDWDITSKPMIMTLEQALEKLSSQRDPFSKGQDFTADAIRFEDTWSVAKLFYEVYGPSFPFEAYYIPEKLWEEHRLGLAHSAVARTLGGNVVGYAGLFRSSAPHHGVYEIGSQVIHPDYEKLKVGLALQEYVQASLIPENEVEVFFSEAPCHQVITQKFGAMTDLRETALEIGLMPASFYTGADTSSGRVSMLLLFGTTRDGQRKLHVPDIYRQAMDYLLQGTGLDRVVLPASDPPPSRISTRISSEYFEFANVARFHVLTMGEDFERTLIGFEEQARRSGAEVLQVFVNLGESWCGGGVDTLRRRGYFLGGLMPRWFDDDGLLMQQVLSLPAPDTIRLFSQRAHRILDLVLRDIESNPACTALSGSRAVTADTAVPRFKASDLDRIVVSGEGLTVDEVVAVARHSRPVRLTEDSAVLKRVEVSASFIEWAVRTGEPIYGVNTGFGGMADVTIPEADLRPLQNNLLRFLNVCTGDYLPLEDVRAAMVLRANSHLRGASGVRRELIDRILVFLNNGVTPLVRSMGSIGASGDLAPLASIAGALVGADPCFKVDMKGEILDCLTALQRLGLTRLSLGPKEGLGMVNGTSVMTGIATTCLYDAQRLLALALGFHALVIQALCGSNQSFHPFIHQLKPHSGQITAARLMLELLDGSRMCRNELDGHHDVQDGQPAQDRYSLRCLPQFLGPVLDGLHTAVSAVETEINSANDNPLIDGDNCLSLHSGNFLGQYIAVWMDHLRYYLGLTAKHMDTQIALLVAPEFNAGLPPSLVGNPKQKVNMGLKGLQIAANSIMPLISYYGAPIADRFPTHAEQFNQNINSQGFNAATLTRKSIEAMQTYTAMALIFGVQAVSLRAASMSDTHDPRPLLSPAGTALYDSVLTVLGHRQRHDSPLIRNDDEQSLEAMIQTLTQDIAGEGKTVDAMGSIVAALGSN